MIAGGRQVVVYKSKPTQAHLWAMGDLHVLNRGSAEDEIRAVIKEIRDDPCGLWLGMGDYAEFIGLGDPRFNPAVFETEITVNDLGQLGKVAMERVRDLFKPIKDKCLGLLVGNHEEKYMMYTAQQQLHDWLCCELGVPNLGYSTLFNLVFVRSSQIKLPIQLLRRKRPFGVGRLQHHDTWAITVFAHHGAGAAQTRGGKMARLERFMKQHEADLYFVAHLHEEMPLRDDRIGLSFDGKRLIAKETLGTITGGFLRTYAEGEHPGYGEMRGYYPTPLGATMVTLTPQKRRMELAISAKVQ